MELAKISQNQPKATKINQNQPKSTKINQKYRNHPKTTQNNLPLQLRTLSQRFCIFLIKINKMALSKYEECEMLAGLLDVDLVSHESKERISLPRNVLA